MSIDITSQIENFKNAKNTWVNTITTQSDPDNLFELTIGINDISFVFDEAIGLLNIVNEEGIHPVEWYSLKSIAANPTRLILKNADPASPAHALFEKSIDEIIKFVKKKIK